MLKDINNMTEEEKLNSVLFGNCLAVYCANTDKKNYKQYKLGDISKLTNDELVDMKVLDLLYSLGYPNNELGTYLYKEVICELYRYINDNFDELMDEINKITNLVKEYMGWDYEKRDESEQAHKANSAILVVDDSNVISNFVTKIFNNTYDVIVAKDGQEAIDKLSSLTQEIAGMLLDLNMPNVDGYEVLKFMKTNDIFNHINVAIITGTDSKEVLELTKGYPIKAILEKPFNETNVKKVVEMVVRR